MEKQETKKCQNCNDGFTIEPDHFAFYEKIKVPPPTWCPMCRQQRRYAWRNERVLYRRNCDLCKKSTVTIYSPNKSFKVYCVSCWWSDGWDPSSYGQDFDFSRSFFEQFSELQHEVPRMALLNKNSVNSEYTNHSADNKNVYLSFCCFNDEDIMYSNWVMKSRDCVDCSFIPEKGERLYECIDTRNSYRCQYCIFLKGCSSCFYCYDCNGCSDCFLSFNLRNKSYVFRNQQYTREEYLEKIKDFDLSSFAIREKLYKEFEDMLKRNAVHRSVIGEGNINSVGNLLYDCKNVFESFEVSRSENCRYIYGGIELKDCMDIYHAGWNTTELCYELQGCTRLSNCQFCHLCYDNMNVSYSDTCQNSQNLFGCVSVKKGEYMIFNKKYSKEEFTVLRDRIIEHMKSRGEYGEFFPPEIALVCYNETQGNLYMPLDKTDVLNKGWQWEDNIPGVFGRATIAIDQIADRIEDTPDSYVTEVFACDTCSKNYNITQNEVSFYRKEKLPLPRQCPDCRYKRRFSFRPTRKLWFRVCMNKGCSNKLETTFSPEKKEKVYCEECYKREVY